MATSLSELVDSMSGNFTDVECESCKENNRCEECKKTIEGLIEKFPSIHQFYNGDLINSFCSYERVFIPMNIWIDGKNLMKPDYHLKTFFVAI